MPSPKYLAKKIPSCAVDLNRSEKPAARWGAAWTAVRAPVQPV
jgi:hypothetical protein